MGKYVGKEINQELHCWVTEITREVSAYFTQIYARSSGRSRIKYIYHIYIYVHLVQSRIVYDLICHILVGFTHWNEGIGKSPCIGQKKKCIFDLTCL